ncbi:hypothetical protein DFJ73DRAFT_875186 [Zopfochytrium polystomum]|nr:hypothetical protein DFJ73DRAFT_875186 [Zopfochytrium polystomum]
MHIPSLLLLPLLLALTASSPATPASAACTLDSYTIPLDKAGKPLGYFYADANTACSAAPLKGFVALTSSNVDAVGNLVTSCLRNSTTKDSGLRAWIKSWNGNDYQGAHMFTQKYYSLPGFGVFSDNANADWMAAVCQT